MTNAHPTISIVIPIYNEFETLPELARQLDALINAHPDYRWEALLVNDGSRDGSAVLLDQLSGQYPWLTAIHLSRNYGHQIALSAGIDHARGDAVVLMDGDLQDPPGLIPQMIARWQSGFDVVYATRETRSGESRFKRWTANAYYRLLHRMTDVDIPLDTGDFRLMSRRVVDAIRQMPEHNRYLRGMVSWVGYPQTALLYHRDERHDGQTKFNLLKMLRFAFDGIISFSKVPLQWIASLGFIVSGLSFLGLLLVIGLAFVPNITIPGWSSLMAMLLLFSGIQLISIGMIGEYVGRIFDEVRNRPLYLVHRIEGRQAGTTRAGITSQDARNAFL